MKKTFAVVLISGAIGLTGCATNKPFTPEEQTIIKQHEIVVKKIDETEPLLLLDKSNKAGEMVTATALGVLTGSFHMKSDGNTPRTRLMEKSSGSGYVITSQARKASAEKIETTTTPTHEMQEILAKEFQYLETEDKNVADKFVIEIKPVAWHLYYEKLFNGENTFFLEYAGDIEMQLASAKISRTITCDRSSDTALSKAEWLANNQLRVRQFSQALATTCVNQIFSELNGKDDAENDDNTTATSTVVE